MAIPEAIPNTLTVIAWPDPIVEAHGYAPTSLYVEGCWTPLIGPSSCLAYRRLGCFAAARPQTIVDIEDLSACLGLGVGVGENSLIVRTLARLERFDIARWSGEHYAVRTALPPLPDRLLHRLPPPAQAMHRHITATP